MASKKCSGITRKTQAAKIAQGKEKIKSKIKLNSNSLYHYTTRTVKCSWVCTLSEVKVVLADMAYSLKM